MFRKKPSPGAINAAIKSPGGWVYEISGGLDPEGDVPPEAIRGAWRVDAKGKIVGKFKKNPNYDPKKYPAKSK